jgi:hypothetical protein
MGKVRVELDDAGMSALLKSAEVAADLRQRGERVHGRATATAPVDTGQFAGTGPAPGGFEVVEHMESDRVTVRVESRDPKGAIKEARHRTLTRALDAAR